MTARSKTGEVDFEEAFGSLRPKEVNMDGPTEWGGPSLSGQFNDEALWEQDGWSVKIFDLAKAKDVAAYQELLTKSSNKDPETIVVDQEKQFCTSTENWKVFVTSVDIKYKNLKKNAEKSQ